MDIDYKSLWKNFQPGFPANLQHTLSPLAPSFHTNNRLPILRRKEYGKICGQYLIKLNSVLVLSILLFIFERRLSLQFGLVSTYEYGH